MPGQSDIVNSAIKRVLSGDKDAYGRIVAQYQDMLTAFAAFRVPDSNLADEVVQQTFIRAYEQLEQFQCDKDFGQWLRTICKYMIMAELKKFSSEARNKNNYTGHIRVVLAQCAEEELQDVDDACDTSRMLQECLGLLPERSRALLNCKYQEQLPASEISERFGQSEGWVATTLFRLRSELKRCIEQRVKLANL